MPSRRKQAMPRQNVDVKRRRLDQPATPPRDPPPAPPPSPVFIKTRRNWHYDEDRECYVPNNPRIVNRKVSKTASRLAMLTMRGIEETACVLDFSRY